MTMFPSLIILLVVAADQFTKMWIVGNFVMFESREVLPGFFNLTYIVNRGAAFGFLAGEHGPWRHIFFVAAAVVALCVMVVAMRQLRDEGKLFVPSLAMIAGGAVGNLIDRLRLGAVVDFLDFYIKDYHWPAFNVADSAITVGVGIFLLAHLCRDNGGGQKRPGL